MKEKSVRFVVFGLVLVLLASVAVGTASAFSNSGGVDWKYYKEITVKDNSGKTLTDFQVLVELNMENFPTKSKSDGSDLRFAEVEKEPVSLRQHAEEFLGGCYWTAKILPKAVIEHPREAATVCGIVIATPFFLNAVGLVYSSPAADSKLTDGNKNFKLPNPLDIVGVASAKSNVGSEIPEDYYDETAELLEIDPQDIMGWDDIKALDKPINELVKIPDEITDMVMEKVYIDKGKTRVDTIKISPTDFAVWMSVASAETKLVKPYLVYLDTDGDSKPEELAALYNYPYKGCLAFEDFSSIEDHYKLVPSGHVPDPYGDFGFVINPFDTFKETPEGLDEYWESTAKLIYIKNPDKIQVLPDKIIPWYEAVGKTPAELGLDKYDRFVSKIPETPDEVPTGEEVTPTPGFEVLFAIAELLAVAYIFRRRK